MKKLSTLQGFKLIKILKKLDIKDELRELSKNANKKGKKDTVENVQMEIAFLLVEHIPDAQKEICEFLGDLVGKTEKEIEEQELQETIKIITDLLSQEGMGSFLTSALK